jgi:hypothetical protein
MAWGGSPAEIFETPSFSGDFFQPANSKLKIFFAAFSYSGACDFDIS